MLKIHQALAVEDPNHANPISNIQYLISNIHPIPIIPRSNSP
jgi:hypothetical protein